MRPTSAKTFYASVQRELIAPLGLKEPNGNLTTPDDTETIDFADASSVVLSLVEDHGKAYYQDDRLANQLVQKVRQRLEESQSWQNGEIELPECKRAIDRAKASINETLSIHPKLRIGETERQTLVLLRNWAAGTKNLEVLLDLASASLAGPAGKNQLAIDQLKKLLNPVEDFNELALRVTDLRPLQQQIDQILRPASQGNLERLIAEAHACLSKPPKVAAGLIKWVGQASSEQEREARQRAADKIFVSFKKPVHPVLILDDRELTNLPVEIGALRHLQELSLIKCKLRSLPNSIGWLNNLQALYLSHNQLESLPDSIGWLNNLQDLSLSYNRLKNLQDSIGGLNNLQDLTLCSNQLHSLPDWIGGLTNLRYLSLSMNQLKSLPDSIGELRNLQRLNVDNNKLENLPDSIGCFTNLQELFLWGNPLKSLPDSISQLNLNAHSLDQIAEVKVRFGGRTIL